jgi:hypothetical protein
VLPIGPGIFSHGSSDLPIWDPSSAPWTTTTNLSCEGINGLGDYLVSLQQKES